MKSAKKIYIILISLISVLIVCCTVLLFLLFFNMKSGQEHTIGWNTSYSTTKSNTPEKIDEIFLKAKTDYENASEEEILYIVNNSFRYMYEHYENPYISNEVMEQLLYDFSFVMNYIYLKNENYGFELDNSKALDKINSYDKFKYNIAYNIGGPLYEVYVGNMKADDVPSEFLENAKLNFLLLRSSFTYSENFFNVNIGWDYKNEFISENSSDRVAKIAKKASADIEAGKHTEELKEVIKQGEEYIRANLYDPYKDNETMENLIYYAYLFQEYAEFKSDGDTLNLKNVGTLIIFSVQDVYLHNASANDEQVKNDLNSLKRYMESM